MSEAELDAMLNMLMFAFDWYGSAMLGVPERKREPYRTRQQQIRRCTEELFQEWSERYGAED